MKSTIDKKTSCDSQFSISYERKLELNSRGSLNQLEQLIHDNNINIDTPEMMRSLPSYMNYMTDKQRVAFQSFYWRQMCIYDIYYTFEYAGVNEIERCLKSAIAKYIKMLKADYGTK